MAGPLADKIGRKWVLLSSSIFFVVAYVLMMIGGEVWVLLVARLVQGFGVGFVMTVQPMYVGEIATDSVRGATGSLMQLFIVCKLIISNAYTHTYIHTLNINLCINFFLFQLVFFMCMPLARLFRIRPCNGVA